MGTVIIVIHLMVIVALVGVVLLQRSEGGALGIGGSNAFLTGRGQGNVLTRATTILGIVFFATSIGMTVLSRLNQPESAILETVLPSAAPPAGGAVPAPATDTAPGSGGLGILDALQNSTGPSAPPDVQAPAPAEPLAPAEPQVPTSQ